MTTSQTNAEKAARIILRQWVAYSEFLSKCLAKYDFDACIKTHSRSFWYC